MIPQSGSAGRILLLTIGFCLIYTATVAAALSAGTRTFQEQSAWMKPLKFGLSTALYLAALLWVQSSLSPAWRQGRAARWIAVTAALCTLFELSYIGIQAARGQASHFNISSPFYAAMYSLMALAAVLLALCSGGFGVLAALDFDIDLPQPVRWSAVTAFLMSMLASIVTGLTMGGRLAHHVGAPAAGAAQVPFTGWSLTVGDLRVAHFLALHLLQAGPLFAWLASRLVSPPVATVLSAGFCLLWSALTWWLLTVAWAGEPFLSPFG